MSIRDSGERFEGDSRPDDQMQLEVAHNFNRNADMTFQEIMFFKYRLLVNG